MPRASPPCTSSTGSRPGTASEHSFSCRSAGWSSHRMDACRGRTTLSGSLVWGQLDPPAQALSWWRYLHEGLLVDLQLCLWCLEGSGGEETQEELPWDLALEGHLQAGMVLRPPPRRPASSRQWHWHPSPTHGPAGKPALTRTLRSTVPLARLRMSCEKVGKVGSAKLSPLLGSIVSTGMGWRGSHHGMGQDGGPTHTLYLRQHPGAAAGLSPGLQRDVSSHATARRSQWRSPTRHH